MKRHQAGWSLVEALVALTVAGLLLAWTAPIAARVVADARTSAAAREFAVLFYALRWRSVSENRHVGLYFERSGAAWQWWQVGDGNGNGLRTAEVRNGVDPKRSGPHRLGTGVRFGFPAGGPIPRIPPRRGLLSGSDPVRFGRSDLISFGPRGRSSSGTLYLTDGRQRLYGVLLYGAATRIRVWRWDREERRWRR